MKPSPRYPRLAGASVGLLVLWACSTGLGTDVSQLEVPLPVSPHDFAVVARSEPVLTVAIGASDAPLDVEISWSADPGMASASSTLLSGLSTDYLTYTLPTLPTGVPHFWRARLAPAGTSAFGPYSELRSLVVDPTAGAPAWRQGAAAQWRAVPAEGFDLALVAPGSPGAVVIGWEATPVFEDDFESGTLAQWSIRGASGPNLNVVNATAADAPSGTRVMRYIDNDGVLSSVDGLLAIATHPAVGRGAAEWWERTDNPSVYAAAGSFGSGWFPGANIGFDNANELRRYSNGGTNYHSFAPPLSWVANTWYRIRLEYVDAPLQTFDVFVDGQWTATGLPYNVAGTGTSELAFGSNGGHWTVTNRQIDDVRVFRASNRAAYVSPAIRAADLGGWDRLEVDAVRPANTAVLVRVEHPDAGTWLTVPDAALPGNEAGHITFPVDLRGLPPARYPTLRLRLELSRASNLDPSPRLERWTIVGRGAPLEYRVSCATGAGDTSGWGLVLALSVAGWCLGNRARRHTREPTAFAIPHDTAHGV